MRAVARTLEILPVLADGPLSIGSIATRVGLPKTTAYRLLLTLEDRGFVVRGSPSGDFRLGPRLFHLGMRAGAVTDLREAGIPAMVRLRDQFGETVNLNVLAGSERLCVASVEGIHEVRAVGVIGQRSPLHSGAAARAILSFLPDERIRAYLATPLRSLASQTVTEPARLWETIREVRRLGYAASTNERSQGAASVGVPIWNATGEVIGSVNVTGPVARLHAYPAGTLSAAVVETGRAISRALGYVTHGRSQVNIEGGM